LRLRIVLVGFGNVGREFARLLLERKSELAKVHGLRADVVAILTGRHGSVERAGGIDLRRALRLADAGVSLETCGHAVHVSSVDYLRRVRADAVIEISPLRIASRQIAVDHIVAALSSGMHVITANYQRLRRLAREHGVGFRYEGTVMDGAPVFNLFQEALRGLRIQSFEGILNSTSNHILSKIEAGGSYEQGVASAREMGLLETDPSMDLDGWDAAVKACLLVNVLMGGRLRPEKVRREGISSLTSTRIEAARASGRRIKVIARGWREGRTVHASVSLESIPPDHPLFSVDGTSSSLVVRTDMLKELQIVERDPGLRQTAYAIYSDLLAIRDGRLIP